MKDAYRLKAWHMLNDSDVVSQFDRNYLGDATQDEVLNKCGVEYHHVIINKYAPHDKLSNELSFLD